MEHLLSPTLSITLAVLSVLLIASASFFFARKAGVPYTAFLAFVGVLLAPLSEVLPGLHFIRDLTLTPDLLFFVFLPTLIFESAYNMNIRRFMDDLLPITALSIASLVISALFIAGVLYGVLSLIGFPIPFMLLFIFGALISATDPVAVLALFKEYGAPRRLAMIFEGESLFNDGTAVALFLIVLGVAVDGYHGASTLLSGVFSFFEMVFGGVLFGIFMGALFSKIIERVRSNEFIEITLMLVLAHLTFILSEICSRTLSLVGHHVHLSAIIATTVAAMVLGNYGRYKVSPKAEAFVEKFWGMLAFVINSLIFILIGFLFADLPSSTPQLIVPIVLTIFVVAIGRAVSVYPIVALTNMFTPVSMRISRAWQHILAWGSLRGALAVTMVLLIPESLTFAHWGYAFTPKDLVLALTVSCIFATLFIKATTIGPFMRRLHADDLTDLEALEYEEVRALVHGKVLWRLEYHAKRGYVDAETYARVRNAHEDRFADACAACTRLTKGERAPIAERVLRLYAIGVERQYSKELYAHGEITEPVMKRVQGKLSLQTERAESGVLEGDVSSWKDRRDIFEHLADAVRRVFMHARQDISSVERFMYYRAQSITAQRVLREIEELTPLLAGNPIFTEDALLHTKERYERYLRQSTEKMEAVAKSADEREIKTLREELTRKGLFKTEELLLDDLYHKEMITPKVYLSLREEFEHMRERSE